MTREQPPEFHFGLPEEAGEALDGWEIEALLMSEAAFVYLDRSVAVDGESEAMSTAMGSLFEDMTWGIDEPPTAADFAFLDEDFDF